MDQAWFGRNMALAMCMTNPILYTRDLTLKFMHNPQNIHVKL
jgi:hypothetical protein